MITRVAALQPSHSKCFHNLMVTGENDSNHTLRDIGNFTNSDHEVEQFGRRHEQ